MFHKICQQCGAPFTTRQRRDRPNCSIACGSHARYAGSEERHQQRRRPKPTPEQRAALMREYVLDMRAAEKHARLGG